MAVDYFLKLNGIQGESQDTNPKDEIQIMTWSWGASNTSSVAGTGGSGAGKVDLSDFNVTTFFDKSTPKLFKTIAVGTHIQNGTMNAIKSGANNKPYLKVDFTEMFVTGLQMSASSEIPSVNISFTYNTIKVDYSVQDENGNVKSTGPIQYSTKENKLT